MATASQVKTGLDEISKMIRASEIRIKNAKSMLAEESAVLASIPTRYADVIATINGYVPTGPFEVLAQDEKAKLQVEFLAVRARIDTLTATTEWAAL